MQLLRHGIHFGFSWMCLHMDDICAVTESLFYLQVAVALEKAALSDEYFAKRKLYPNVDFYSGLIYRYEWYFIKITHCYYFCV